MRGAAPSMTGDTDSAFSPSRKKTSCGAGTSSSKIGVTATGYPRNICRNVATFLRK